MLRFPLAVVALSLTRFACASDVHVRVDPTVTTGTESTTQYPTIQMALDHHPFATLNPDGTPGRVFIEIAPATYRERIIVTQNHTNITLLGMGKSPADVVITNALNAKTAGGTFFTETAEINGTGFEADNVTFENAAGNTGQAVAAAVRADRAIFKHCRFLGHQDTLFADFGRQYYVDSYIEGGVDYIFGNATAVFDRMELHSNGPGAVTAQSRTSPDQTTGYVITNSRITAAFERLPLGSPSAPQQPAAPTSINPYNDGVVHSTDPKPKSPPDPSKPPMPTLSDFTIILGRPWRPFARVIVMNSDLPARLSPFGWSKWKKDDPTPTAFYAEYNNTGAGSKTQVRPTWTHQLTAAEAAAYAPATFLAGPPSGPDHWDPIAEAAKLP